MMVEALVYFFVPALVGVLIGIASGLLGIGGGTVMVPIFRLAFGMSATMSTATSLFAIIPTSISGAISHVKGKTCIPALGIAAGLGGACLSPVGVWLPRAAFPRLARDARRGAHHRLFGHQHVQEGL